MSPLAEQTVGSVFAENHLTVDFGGDLECNLARSVRCDDIGTRRLRRDDQMDTSRAGHLRDARNRALHIGCQCLYQTGKFVDDNDDVWNFARNLDIVFWSRVAGA
jgi:hypothetical protein